jgi:cytidine deaminase
MSKLRNTQKDLVKLAIEARKDAYAPYSKFRVGAALETSDGKVYTGCNVENSAYSATCCAERVALVKAISDGKKKFKRLVVASDNSKICPPCGVCRQSFAEFVNDMEVIMSNSRGKIKVARLKDLLPSPFRSLK